MHLGSPNEEWRPIDYQLFRATIWYGEEVRDLRARGHGGSLTEAVDKLWVDGQKPEPDNS